MVSYRFCSIYPGPLWISVSTKKPNFLLMCLHLYVSWSFSLEAFNVLCLLCTFSVLVILHCGYFFYPVYLLFHVPITLYYGNLFLYIGEIFFYDFVAIIFLSLTSVSSVSLVFIGLAFS